MTTDTKTAQEEGSETSTSSNATWTAYGATPEEALLAIVEEALARMTPKDADRAIERVRERVRAFQATRSGPRHSRADHAWDHQSGEAKCLNCGCVRTSAMDGARGGFRLTFRFLDGAVSYANISGRMPPCPARGKATR